MASYFAAAHQRRAELTEQVYQLTKGTVHYGPFTGMKIERKTGWGDGDMGSKLLGCYECEIYPYINMMMSYKPNKLVNVGCGEGFYGIGIGLQCPGISVTMIDIKHNILDIARLNADRNAIKAEFSLESNPEFIDSALSPFSRPMVVMDCEGFEVDLLDPNKVPSLLKSMILVEVHDFIRPQASFLLTKRFESSHRIFSISQGAKNPYKPIMSQYTDWDKMLLCVEGRPCTMSWLCMLPN